MNFKKLKSGFSLGYAFFFIIPYVVVPYVFAYSKFPVYVSLLAQMTIISTLAFWIAFNVPFGLSFKTIKVSLEYDNAMFVLYGLFLFIVLIIFITAPNIPIIESLRGASDAELIAYREGFVKTRTGIEASLGYVIGMISTFFLPYFITLSFLRNHKYKYVFIGVFLIYSITFLEKAYFLKVALPLFFLYLFNAKNIFLHIIKSFALIFIGFMFMYSLATKTQGESNSEDYFSILYIPTSSVETMIWRAGVVPIVTALDGVRVFLIDFKGEFLYGNTSSFIAFLTGSPRINFERFLYQEQMGGGSETGNANQFYLIEAFINFGYTGVILFSMIVGKLMKHCLQSKDLALIAVLPLFLLNLFSSGLIGNLLSNGFLFFFLFIKFVKLK
jgi:hypothetical protein